MRACTLLSAIGAVVLVVDVAAFQSTVQGSLIEQSPEHLVLVQHHAYLTRMNSNVTLAGNCPAGYQTYWTKCYLNEACTGGDRDNCIRQDCIDPPQPGYWNGQYQDCGPLGLGDWKYRGMCCIYPTSAPTKPPTKTPTKTPTNTPTKTPTLTPTESPTLTPTESPTLTPTGSPTEAPTTQAPTAAPTTDAPTVEPPTPATATGDPHLVNTRGEHFSIFESGNVEFIRVPYELTTEEAEFTLHANIQSFGEVDKCKEARYIAGLLFDGSWFEGKPLKVTVDVAHPGATKKEMKVSFGGNPVLPSTEPIDLGNRMFLHVHNATNLALNVAGANFAADLQWFFLNVELSSIQKLAEKIGGLLGEDDHSAVSKKPSLGCDPVLLGKTSPSVHSVAHVVTRYW